MTSTSVTEPIARARRARHRRPNRRRNVIARALGLALVAASAVTVTTAASSDPSSPAFYGLTAAQAVAAVHLPACATEDSVNCYAASMPWHTAAHECHTRRLNCAAVGTELGRELGIVGRTAVLVLPASDPAYVLVQDGAGTEVYGA